MTNRYPLEPPPSFVSNLLELREYYAQLVKEYEMLCRQARSQLNHVEALLSPSLSPHHVDILQEIPSQSPVESLSPVGDKILTSSKLLPEESNSEDSKNKEMVSEEPQSSEPKQTSIDVPDVAMLPDYQGKGRIQAIKGLLQKHIGTLCHVDFIVRSLYGELEPSAFKIAKSRVQSSLAKGKERRIWATIPDEPGCYTLDLSLVNSHKSRLYSQPKNTPKKQLPAETNKSSVPMLQEFEGLFLIDALSDFLEKYSGKAFSVSEIIHGIYGELEEEEFKGVKGKVLNELSRGYRTGRFSRLHNKIGFYTWDSKLMLATSRRR